MTSPGSAHVIIDSDLVAATIIVKLTAAERKFVEKQARLELRTISNFVRSLIIEKMNGE